VTGDSVPGLRLRPITDEDEAFLCAVYASTRQEELAVTGWDQERIDAFLRMQFEAQHRYYHETFPPSDYLVIEQHGEPVGRIYIGRWEDNIRLIDIALLPEHRNQGIGTQLVRELMAEAEATGKPVQLHVEFNNPARYLYERLGFHIVEERGINYFMEWRGEGFPPP
jgi:ribosomal protein S18 acetylase RimI-like enzyme